ncbi:MAG: alpha/beta fold hydrolase [Planctomycetaceae bacterium]
MRNGVFIVLAVVLAAPATAGEDNLFETWTTAVQEKAMNGPTLGGRIFWGDVLHFRGWRIQQNVLTKHHRLIDPADVRHASGTLDDCAVRLDEIKREKTLAPLAGKAVILVHGMGRSSKSWPKLTQRLEEEGYLVVGFDYPSTRCALSDSAEYLAKVIESLDGVDEIHFVCHSMGGLVVRAYLAEHDDPRIKRMVMLAVPNQGAEMADLVAIVPLYRWVCGPGGCELVTDPDGIIASLPTPTFEFAVIAAARGTAEGYNPLIPGDDDGTITVASTQLPGAADFLQVNGLMHSFLMFDERVIDATVRFLEMGKLREEGEPQPIPREPVEAEAGMS